MTKARSEGHACQFASGDEVDTGLSPPSLRRKHRSVPGNLTRTY